MRTMTRHRALLVATCGCAAVVLAACSAQGDSTAASTAPAAMTAPAPTTLAPTTVVPSTAPPTTQAPTTLAPTTTVAPTLPTPIAPPPPDADEPVVELGTIEIPSLGVVEPMYSGITDATLDRGPGHWPGTAMPGRIGNVVVAGHRTSHSRPFRHIDRLTAGDEVVFNTADGRFVYEVVGSSIVEPTALYIVDQTPEATATLFACHPPGSVAFRWVTHLALRSDISTPGA